MVKDATVTFEISEKTLSHVMGWVRLPNSQPRKPRGTRVQPTPSVTEQEAMPDLLPYTEESMCLRLLPRKMRWLDDPEALFVSQAQLTSLGEARESIQTSEHPLCTRHVPDQCRCWAFLYNEVIRELSGASRGFKYSGREQVIWPPGEIGQR